MPSSRGAELSDANLQDAYLRGANLQEVRLFDANLQGAELQGAIYEPIPEKLPSFWTLADPHNNNVEKLVFHRSPAALIALREAFKRGGMRTQERRLTYAIEHTKRLQARDPSWYGRIGKDTRVAGAVSG